MAVNYGIVVVEISEDSVIFGWEDFEAGFHLKKDGKIIFTGKSRIGGGDCWIPDLVFQEMEKNPQLF